MSSSCTSLRKRRATSNLSIDLLKYWKKKEIVWPALAKMVKQYLAAPASSKSAGVRSSVCGVFSARLARSIVHDDLAEEVGQGFHIGIFAVCCVQHGLVYRLVAALLRIGTMRCVYHARDVLFLDLISGLGISLFLLTTVQGCMEREVYHLHPFASIWGPLAYTSQRCWYPGTRVDRSPQAPRCGVHRTPRSRYHERLSWPMSISITSYQPVNWPL